MSATPSTIAPAQTTTLVATGGSGSGSVTYAQISGTGVCSLSGATVTALAEGDCWFSATKSGDLNYYGWRFSGSADEGVGRFAFATSLSQLRAAATEEQARRAREADPALGLGHGGDQGRPSLRPSVFDVWLEGTGSYLRTDRPEGRRDGQAAVVSAGMDYLLRPGLIAGMMLQMDWIADNAKGTLAQSREGRGWMAGPYVSMRLLPNLYFDARALWGRSANTIDPLGGYTDRFDTTRTLLSAKLTGEWACRDLTMRPRAEATWFNETAATYTNATGIDIAAQTYALGRLAVGPEFAYRMSLPDGTMLEPFVGLEALWDFAKMQEISAAGTAIDPGEVRGRVEFGDSLRTPAGIALRAAGSYDGIGSSSYHAVQGKAQLVVPLH